MIPSPGVHRRTSIAMGVRGLQTMNQECEIDDSRSNGQSSRSSHNLKYYSSKKSACSSTGTKFLYSDYLLTLRIISHTY